MRFLVTLLLIGVMTYAILDCVRTEDPRHRLGLPAWAWVVLILLLPGVGAVIWIVVSRVARAGGDAAPRGATRPVAPDDDPDFLADLAWRARRDAAPPAVDDSPPSAESPDPSPDQDETHPHRGGQDGSGDTPGRA